LAVDQDPPPAQSLKLMKRALITIVLSAAALGIAAAQDSGFLLLRLDSAPEDPAGHAPEVLAPGWAPDASAAYPRLRWMDDPEDAPAGGNGHFMRGVRGPGDNSGMYLQSNLLDVADLKHREYELAFSFKMGAGSNGGVLDLRFVSWVVGLGWQWENLRLFNQGATLGEPGVSMENTFTSLNAGPPDAHGWRTVSVTGTFKSDSVVRVWVAPWTFGDANTAAGHFTGSWNITDVTLRVRLPEHQTPVGVELIDGDEVGFFAEAGRVYRIDSSGDQETWTPAAGPIEGQGQYVRRFFSRGPEPKTYRVVEQ